MRNVEYGMGHECKREDGQRVPWIADHCRTGDDQETDRERNFKSHALHSIVRHCKADVNTGCHRQEQRRELSEPEL